MNTKQFKQILLLVLLLTFSTLSLEGKCAAPEKQNYIESVIAHSTGFEQMLFKALQGQPGCDLLLKSLGIIQPMHKQEFGSVKFPGKKQEALYSDNGETFAINFRKKLAWHRTYGRAPNIRQIMVFAPSGSKPSSLTLLITRDNLNFLTFTECQLSEFDGARLLRNGANAWLLEIQGKNRAGAADTKTFRVTAQNVLEVTSKT